MSRKTWLTNLGAASLAVGLLLAGGDAARADLFGWFGCCCEKCPPPFWHCMEGPPCIKYKCGCPKPVCDPCHLHYWGYYQNCWHPWPWPPNFGHCYDFPPAPGGPQPPLAIQMPSEAPGAAKPTLAPPRRLDGEGEKPDK